MNNSEQALVSGKANVMIYDDAAKKWNPSGSGPGVARVIIYQHLLNHSYRVVGRKIQDSEVVLNCTLAKGLKYNQANQTFLQWRDVKHVYGLNFQTKEEADVFAQTIKLAVENLNRIAAALAVNGGGGGGSQQQQQPITTANNLSTNSSANSSCSSGKLIAWLKSWLSKIILHKADFVGFCNADKTVWHSFGSKTCSEHRVKVLTL